MNKDFDALWLPRAIALLRIVSGYLIIQHGMAKLLHFPHVAMFDNLAPLSLIGFAGMLELAGGALLILGLFTRPVAFVLSGEMAAAYFIGHVPHGFFIAPMLNQGELAVLYCFVFLLLAATGAGTWSIDTARRVHALGAARPGAAGAANKPVI